MRPHALKLNATARLKGERISSREQLRPREGDDMAVSIDLSDDEERRIAAVTARTGQPVAEFVHEAIVTHLDEADDVAWAENAAMEWAASDQKTRPVGELRRELGL
jgi:RHH-type rel operon transcriptional repressor/antitoxin RelB